LHLKLVLNFLMTSPTHTSKSARVITLSNATRQMQWSNTLLYMTLPCCDKNLKVGTSFALSA
jgi:hypothetical protein